MADVIEAEGLEKRFGQTRALAGAGFSARRGTVLANACGAGGDRTVRQSALKQEVTGARREPRSRNPVVHGGQDVK